MLEYDTFSVYTCFCIYISLLYVRPSFNLECIHPNFNINSSCSLPAGKFTNNGTFAVDTGKFTGRSPNDKWIVQQAPSADNIWWGNVNKPTTSDVFDNLYAKCIKHYNTLDDIYVFDGHCGASPKTRKNVRFITGMYPRIRILTRDVISVTQIS